MKQKTVFIFLAALSLSVSAKQNVVAIEIRGDSLAAPIVITDVHVVDLFSVWNGPGTRSYDGTGRLNSPAYLDSNKHEGRFVDWPRGIVNNRPRETLSFDVVFYVGHTPNQRPYPFTYAIDSTVNQGFIFLPPDSTTVIVHGVEGNWFYASKKWDEIMSPLILAATE